MSLNLRVELEQEDFNGSQPDQRFLDINTIIIDQEISAAWKFCPSKLFRNILGSDNIFQPCILNFFETNRNLLLFIMCYIALFMVMGYYVSLTIVLLTYFLGTVSSILYIWFSYRYNNIFYRMGINPKSKEKADVQEILNVFLLLLNNNYLDKSENAKKILFKKLGEKIVESSSFARYPVIDLYREIMVQASTSYDTNLRKKREEERKNIMISEINNLIPNSIENYSLDNETSKKLLLSVLQKMNLKS